MHVGTEEDYAMFCKNSKCALLRRSILSLCTKHCSFPHAHQRGRFPPYLHNNGDKIGKFPWKPTHIKAATVEQWGWFVIRSETRKYVVNHQLLMALRTYNNSQNNKLFKSAKQEFEACDRQNVSKWKFHPCCSSYRTFPKIWALYNSILNILNFDESIHFVFR